MNKQDLKELVARAHKFTDSDAYKAGQLFERALFKAVLQEAENALASEDVVVIQSNYAKLSTYLPEE